jgi:hypothetical protein
MARQTKPNVVFILADNVGWGDIGCYGGTAPTPRIDALASQGLRVRNYNVEAQCTPTRSAILTRRLPIRTGCYSVPFPGQGEYGLAPWEYTLGELFSDADYATALYGKWHVGEAEGRLPIDQGFVAERPQLTKDRSQYVFYPDLSVVPIGTAPKVFNRPHSITADVTIPDGGAEGVLLAQGGVAGGFVLYVKDGKLHYIHNYLGLHEYKVTSASDVPKGRIMLRFEFEPTGTPDIAKAQGAPGRAQLYCDGALVGNAEFVMTVPLIFGIEGLSCGYDFGEAVTHNYHAPYRFTGTIHRVTVDLSGELIQDEEAEMRVLMARQ